MTTTMPSRQAIEQAGDLDFTPRTKQEPLTITVHAVVAGFATELCFTGSIDQLPALAARLIALGATPTTGNIVLPVEKPRKPAQRVEPIYQPDGTPCCPVHKRPLADGQYGLFCKSKAQPGDVQNDKGYCSLKFAE